MKIYMKILVFFVLLFSLSVTNTLGLTVVAKAAYDEANLSCTIQQGRDIVFVIQDSPDILNHDSDQSRITEVLKLIDESSTQDRFGLIGFNVAVTKELALTNNKVKAKNTLKLLDTERSDVMGNDLSVGLKKAVDELTKKSTSNDKMIVIMTVGTSINNEVSLKLAAEAYDANIIIHTISFGDTGSADVSTLKKIAKPTEDNYSLSVNAVTLQSILSNLNMPVKNFTGREVMSDWTLTQDVVEQSGLLIHNNVKVNLNGYNLTVNGDLVLQSCSELRAVSGVITAEDIQQQSRSTIYLNNSQLHAKNKFTQDGVVYVNGNFGSSAVPEVKVKQYDQRVQGYLKLAGQLMEVETDFSQEGLLNLEKGRLTVKGNATQKGYLNVQEGTLQIGGNLTINGGSLVDEAFTENKSLNVGGGVVKIGEDDGVGSTGNIKQLGGQLYVNHGTVEIFGDYTISDGWLTMVKGSMDTKVADYGPGDGDYVHVHGNFSMASMRNHMARSFSYLGLPMNDQAHLTDGVLKIDGDFSQLGNTEFHNNYSDRYQKYEKNYSKYNFNASGRHKVLLTGKGKISVESAGFEFNILEVEGKYSEYNVSGPVKWKYAQLIERSVSNNARLASLAINDIPIVEFEGNKLNYPTHHVPPGSMTSGIPTLKVDARAEDYLHAKVEVLNNVVKSDGTAEVKILVTAHDGKTQNIYTVLVKVGEGTNGHVTSVELDRKELLFLEDDAGITPNKATLSYTVYPKNAVNQEVTWISSDDSVVEVNQLGIVTPQKTGQATITVTTKDGNFSDSVTVKVLKQNDLLEGIKTLADLVSDQDRYNRIVNGLYNLNKIGIYVPGKYIKSIDFKTVGSFGAVGTVKVKDAVISEVDKIEVSINGDIKPAFKDTDTDTFTFSRIGMTNRDYVEVIAYNAAGSELERVSSSFPMNFQAGAPIAPGFYPLSLLFADEVMFSIILDYYSPEEIKFGYSF